MYLVYKAILVHCEDSLQGYSEMEKCTLYSFCWEPYTHFAGNLIIILLGTLYSFCWELSCILGPLAWIFRNEEMYLIIKSILLSNILVTEDSLLGYLEMGKCTLYLIPFCLVTFLYLRTACLCFSEMGKNEPYI